MVLLLQLQEYPHAQARSKLPAFVVGGDEDKDNA